MTSVHYDKWVDQLNDEISGEIGFLGEREIESIELNVDLHAFKLKGNYSAEKEKVNWGFYQSWSE